jgi:hypothetical protein
MKPSNHPIILKVRAALIAQGTNLRAVCLERGIDDGNIYKFLRGEINSDKAKEARAIVYELAGLDDDYRA